MGILGEVYLLKPQEGTWSYLFYGEVNPKALGDIVNVRVIDSENPDGIILKSDDTTDIDDPGYIYNLGYNPSRWGIIREYMWRYS